MDNAGLVNGVDHYENFPVASILCPPRLRPPIVAVYHFARTADDMADEGSAGAESRLADLADYGTALQRLYEHGEVAERWASVFGPLRDAVHTHRLPQSHLADLLDAFAQDVRNPPYPHRDALLDYCRRSANPVGRLLLHLYGVKDEAALRRSDAICTALQLINFWQDLSVDLPRGRCYVPAADLKSHGIGTLEPGHDTAQSRALVRELCSWAKGLMQEGAPLVHQLPGRTGWELRLVVQGGLRILETISAMDHASLTRRPALRKRDVPRMLWRALRMQA